jgi:hypothetical protein
VNDRADDAVLEIRTYQLRPGAGAQFDRLFRERARPLLDRHGIDVVWHGPSMDDPDSYTLMRSSEVPRHGTVRSRPSTEATSGATVRESPSWP